MPGCVREKLPKFTSVFAAALNSELADNSLLHTNYSPVYRMILKIICVEGNHIDCCFTKEEYPVVLTKNVYVPGFSTSVPWKLFCPSILTCMCVCIALTSLLFMVFLANVKRNKIKWNFIWFFEVLFKAVANSFCCYFLRTLMSGGR